MRPPLRCWALTVTTSLLMTSSLVMAQPPPGTITVVNGCTGTEKTNGFCEDPTQTPSGAAGDKTLKCNQGFALESTVLDDTDLLKVGASLKATCYSKCHSKFVYLKCTPGQDDCSEPTYAYPKLSCDPTKELFFNNRKMTTHIANCDTAGWKDQTTKILDFTTTVDHNIRAFCKTQPTIPIPAQCSFEVDCTVSSTCVGPTLDSAKKLSCASDQILMVWGSKLYDHAKCTATGWDGYSSATVTSPDKLIVFGANPSSLRAHCDTYANICKDQYECPFDKKDCARPVWTQNKLACTNHPNTFLTIGDGIYKEAQCSKDGWKANTIDLLKYTKTPILPKIQAYCQDCSTMFVDECVHTDCNQNNRVKYASNKINCPANHILIVLDKDYTELTCSAAGWKTATATILDYSIKIEKLRAKCLSKCHKRFVDMECTPPCNKPIYMNEGQPMFCKESEQLVLNGKEVPDVTCDITKGWMDGDKVLLPFNEYEPANSNTVKASCKKRATTPLPPPLTTPSLPPVTTPPVVDGNVTDAPSPAEEAQTGGGNDSVYIVIIVILIGAILIGIASFYWYIKKKKKGGHDDDDENPTQTRTDSKNKSTKKGKKGKKGKKSDGKSEKKKGKKGKKEKEKSKKEMEIKSDVEVPEQQMSLPCDSTIPLTAALGAPPGPNPNVMNI